MRAFLLAIVIGLALAGKNTDDAFRARTEYTYKYESQLLTGNVPSSKIHTGIKFSALAHVQFITYSDVRVRFTNIVLYGLEQPIVQYEADSTLYPSPDLREMLGADAVVIIKYLAKPFGFTYDDGHVERIHFSNSEMWWSANAKRGFVSLFEVNLRKRWELPKHLPSIPIPPLKPYNEMYYVLEKSPEGECATLYAKDRMEKTDEVHVFKTRDFDHCIGRPVYFKTMFEGNPIEGALKENPVSVQTHIHYNMRVSGLKKFIINNVVASEMITFAPHTEKLRFGDQGELRTTVNQTLILVASRMIYGSNKIEEIKDGKVRSEELRMTLPSLQVSSEDPFSFYKEEPQMIPHHHDVYPWEKIYTLLRMVADNNLELTSDEALTHLRLVSDMMRTSPKQVLVTLWNKLYVTKSAKDDTDRLAADIFFNLLPSIGTQPAAKLVLDICTSDVTMLPNCTLALNVLTLKTKVTPRLIAELLVMIRQRHEEFTPQLKQVAYLTLGSFGFKLMEEKHRHERDLLKAEELLTPLMKVNSRVARNQIKARLEYVKNNRKAMLTAFEQIGNRIVNTLQKLVEKGNTEDKILGLKAIANSGLPFTMGVLKKILYNRQQPQFIRIMAILGFRRIVFCWEARVEAIDTLYGIFSDYKEGHEIRNMAFVVMVGLRPNLPVYEKIGNSMNYEKDQEVSTFVLGFMETMANSTFEPVWPVSRNMSIALKTAPFYQPGRQHSFFKFFGYNYPEYKFGTAYSLTTIGSPHRFEGWALNLDTVIYGQYSKFFEVGVNTVGLTPVLNKLFGPRGVLTSNKSLFDILKRSPRSTSPQDFIFNIFKQLKIKARVDEFPSGHIYFKMFGHEMRYFEFSDYLRDFTTTGKVPFTFDYERLAVGLPVNIQKVMFLFNTKLTLPTTAGFPVSMWLQIATNVKMSGTFAFNVKPFLLESQRQGRPPTGLAIDLDIDTKSVTGVYGSMGLDAFFTKSTHGFYGLVKMNVPIKQHYFYDFIKQYFTTTHTIPKQNFPVMEVKMEPVSEHYKITTELNETPVAMFERNSIYAPVGHKIMPLYIPYACEFLGWKLEITGQLPRRAFNPLMPFTGRSIVNLYFTPLEKPTPEVTLRYQYFANTPGPVPLSYARSYQDTMTEDKTYHPKYDKFGRQLPEDLNDIVPYSDPIDLSKDTITITQMVQKFQKVLGRIFYFPNAVKPTGFAITVDADYSEEVKRHMQFEFMYSNVWSGQVNRALVRYYLSPIDGYTTEPFEFVTDLRVSFPFIVSKPEDVYSVEWQRNLLQEINYHIKYDAKQVVNNLLNQTLLSVIQKTNYPAMKKITSYRVLEGLIPQRLLELMNVTTWPIDKENWDSYWKDLMPMYDLLVEEDRLNMDPYFTPRESLIKENLKQFLNIQARLKEDFDYILSKNTLHYGEMPIMQWITLRQDEVLFMFNRIIIKDTVKGIYNDLPKIKIMLRAAYTNARVITEKMNEIVSKVTFVSYDIDEEGNPIVIAETPEDREHAYSLKDYNFNDFSEEQNPNTEDRFDYTYESKPRVQKEEAFSSFPAIRTNFYKLILFQSEVIREIQTKLTTTEKIDFETINYLIKMTSRNITFFDTIFKSLPIEDEIIMDELLTLTTCNEFIVRLLEEHRDELAYTFVETDVDYEYKVRETYDSVIIKINGLMLAPRIAYLTKARMAFSIIAPELRQSEMLLWKEIQDIKRSLIVENRWFTKYVAFNVTTLKNSEIADPLFKTFTTNIYGYILKMRNIIDNMRKIEGYQPIYLVSELTEIVDEIKAIVEFARYSTLPVTYTSRLSWIETLDKQATIIQEMLAEMYPLFDKYSEKKVPSEIPIFSSEPFDLHTLDIEDLIMQQNQMLEQIRRFLYTPQVPRMIQQKVMDTVVDRLSYLIEILKEKKITTLPALEMAEPYERSIIAAIYTKAMNQHRIILELVKYTLEQRRDILEMVSEMIQKVTTFEYDLSTIEKEFNDKLYQLKSEKDIKKDDVYNYNDDYYPTYQDEPIMPYNDADEDEKKTFLPIEPYYSVLPPSVRCFVNMTWGYGEVRDKKAILQILAMRSVEQVFYLYKQLNAVIRSQDLVYAVERGLQGKIFDRQMMIEALNTYNHIHSFLKYDPETIPDWVKIYARYAQDYLKVLLWNHYTLEEPAALYEGYKYIQTVFDISDFNNNFNMYLMNKWETDVYTEVPLKKWVEKVLPNKGSIHYKRQLAKIFMADIIPPVCYVYKNKVQTFDTVSYSLSPETDQCLHLLAMDCSKERSFAITMLKANSSFEAHILRIYNDDKIIEIIPSYLNVQVKVNGEIMVLKENTPISFDKQLEYQMVEPSLTIVRKGLRVEVDLTFTGVKVTVEGYYIKVEVSPLFKNRLCGLCSNFDSQTSWEWEGPLREIYTTPISFAESYILPSYSCPMIKVKPHELPELHPIPPPMHDVDYSVGTDTYREVMKPYRPRGGQGKFDYDEDSEEPEYEEDTPDTCSPVKEHDYRVFRRRSQICFSMEPFFKCPFDCSTVSSKKQRIQYVCIDNKRPEVIELKKAMSEGEIQWENYDSIKITRKNTRRRTVRYAQECQPEDF